MFLCIDVGIRNCGLCLLDANRNIKHWDVLNIASDQKKVKTMKLEDICKRFFASMTSLMETLDIHKVYIELQLNKNRRMLFASHVLFAFFIHHGIDVSYVKASKKLQMYDGPHIPCSLKTKYARNKYLGIKQAEYFLEASHQTEQLALLRSHKKKDDMADCYLMGLAVIPAKVAAEAEPAKAAAEAEA